MVTNVNVLDTMDLSNPFGVPAGPLSCGLDNLDFGAAREMTLPAHLQEAHCNRQAHMRDGNGSDRGESISDGAFRRLAWGAGPFNSGSGGNGLGMAAAAAARTAARTPSPTSYVWNQEEDCYDEGDDFVNLQLPRQLPPRGVVGLSSAPNLVQHSHRSHSTGLNDSLDSWSVQSGRDPARKKKLTLFGGKTEYFGRTFDSTPTNQVFMEDIVNRGKSEKGFQSLQRPPPRPAPDFRQTEAWQRAYASRQRSRRPKQPASERPRVSVPRARARSQQRGGQQHDATDPLQSSSCFVAMEDTCYGGQRQPTMAAPEPNPEPNGPLDTVAQSSTAPPPCRSPSSGTQERPPVLPTVVGWPPKGRSWKLTQDASSGFDAQAHPLAAPCPASCTVLEGSMVTSGAPPGPPSCFPRSRSASPDDMNPGFGSSCGDGPLHGGADRFSAERSRSPSTNDVPLKEMQRLLSETWRCQQLGDMAVAGSGATSFNAAENVAAQHPGASSRASAAPISPVHFSHSDSSCAPPPICSDFVEVRAPDGENSRGSTEVPFGCGCSSGSFSAASAARPGSCGGSMGVRDGSKMMSPEYVFLGRLVATLPGDEAAPPPSTCQGPSTPQAVVECNFWQLREALGNSPRASACSSATTEAPCNPTMVPPPLLGAALPRPLSFSRSASTLYSTPAPFSVASLAPQEKEGEEDDEFPPWPHEM